MRYRSPSREKGRYKPPSLAEERFRELEMARKFEKEANEKNQYHYDQVGRRIHVERPRSNSANSLDQ